MKRYWSDIIIEVDDDNVDLCIAMMDGGNKQVFLASEVETGFIRIRNAIDKEKEVDFNDIDIIVELIEDAVFAENKVIEIQNDYENKIAELAKKDEEIVRLKKALDIIETKSEPFKFQDTILTNEQVYLCEIYLIAREALERKE